MSGVTDPEGFKMLVRGSLPGILENCAPDQLEETAEAAVKALGKAWRIVETACPDHTYEKAHARGGGGGGFRGGGGGGVPKSFDDDARMKKYPGATWRELAEDRRRDPETNKGTRGLIEWIEKKEKREGNPEKAAFMDKLLRETSPQDRVSVEETPF